MATKDSYQSSKNDHDQVGSNTLDNCFNNTNLNQNYKFVTDSKISKSKNDGNRNPNLGKTNNNSAAVFF